MPSEPRHAPTAAQTIAILLTFVACCGLQLAKLPEASAQRSDRQRSDRQRPEKTESAEADKPEADRPEADGSASKADGATASSKTQSSETSGTKSGDTTQPVDVEGSDDAGVDEPLPITVATPTQNTVIDLGESPGEIRFTFQEAPWADVLREFASWTGKTLDLTDTPPGYFSYFDNRTHSPVEAVDILNGYLLPRGYVLLRRDQFLVCLKTDNDVLPSLVPMVSVEDLDQRGDNDLVRVVVPLEEVSAEVAAEEVSGILGTFGEATPLQSSRSIVLQGFGARLRQALDVLSNSRPPLTDDKLDFRSFTVEHLPVVDAEKQIRNLFGVANPERAKNVSGARYEIERSRYYRDRDRGSRDRDRDEKSPPPIPLLQKVAMNMQISSLQRTNTLLVTATPEGLELVQQVLDSIDVPTEQTARELAQLNEPSLRVYGMVSADESEVAKTIDVLLPGVIVNEDRRQDTIHVFGTPEEHDEVERLIRILDVSEGGERTVEVIPLRKSNPVAMASFLNQLFSNADRDERPMVQAEVPSRSIVVRGTANQVAEVRDALRQFGEGIVSTSDAGSERRIRRVEVGGRDAGDIAEAVQQIYSSNRSGSPRVRVVVPGEGDPDERSTRDSKSGSRAAEKIKKEESVPVRKTLHSDRMQWIPTDSVPASMSGDATAAPRWVSLKRETPVEDSTTDERAGEETTAETPSTVRVQVVDGELLIYSGDEQAVAQVEQTVRELVRQMPSRTRWTVFYLKVAEADKASLKLMELMGEELYPYTSSSGVALTEDTSDTLRIIPDRRTNALFVSGNDRQVDKVEMFLEFIDATDVPGSFNSRQPHAIPVRYADVNQIAELIRNLYKDYLVDPVAERMRASRGDRDRGGDDRRNAERTAAAQESPGIRLTLAVDTTTKELLVACNDQLYEEIEAVVRERDLAVRDARPTIEFVPISGNVPDNLVEMLEGLSPNISAEVILPRSSDSSSRRIDFRDRRSDDRNRSSNRDRRERDD